MGFELVLAYLGPLAGPPELLANIKAELRTRGVRIYMVFGPTWQVTVCAVRFPALVG